MKKPTKGHIMAKKDNNLAVYVSGYEGLLDAIRLASEREVVLSYKEHNGILSLSTLKTEGNGWKHLDFYDSLSLLEEFIEDWICNHPGVEHNLDDEIVTGFVLYNDTYLYQNSEFRKETRERKRLILNRHIAFRVEPRLFRA